MGLDMYLLKVKKLNKRDINEIRSFKTTDDATEAGYTYMPVDDNTRRLTASLFRHGAAATVTLDKQVLDIDKIEEDYHIPEDAYQTGSFHSTAKNSFMYEWKQGDVSVRKVVTLDKEGREHYTVSKSYDFYVFKEKDADYWRKYYDLQNFIYECFRGNIENCGYYVLSDEVLESIYEFIKEDNDEWQSGRTKPPKYNPDKEVIVYHEWY